VIVKTSVLVTSWLFASSLLRGCARTVVPDWSDAASDTREVAIDAIDTTDTPPTDVIVLPSGLAIGGAAGGDSTCLRTSAGEVWCWGANDRGQLGDGTTIDRLNPVQVRALPNATAIALGDRHACARTSDRRVFCWGDNTRRQLGTFSGNHSALPIEIAGIHDARGIASGGSTNCVIASDTTILCWGANDLGQLGRGSITPFEEAGLVTGITGARMVATSADHSCAILDDDGRLPGSERLHCWGSNTHGQLGDGTTTSSTVPVRTMIRNSWVVLGPGVSCTGVGCWGANNESQLGDPAGSDRLVPMIRAPGSQYAIGDAHVCAAGGSRARPRCVRSARTRQRSHAPLGRDTSACRPPLAKEPLGRLLAPDE
jgi:hypothetical protein